MAATIESSEVPDAPPTLRLAGSTIQLPSEPADLVEYIRRERYASQAAPDQKRIINHPLIRRTYYSVRALLPDNLRRYLQRVYLSDWHRLPFPSWPLDFTVDTVHEEFLRATMTARGIERVPFIWFWPEGAPSCLILTHDVENTAGRDFTSSLMNLDRLYGFSASFQVVPEQRYEVPQDYVREIRDRGFEFNVHDLNHDGNLFRDRQEFLRRAQKINGYCRQYQAHGFRTGSMHHNADWYDAFDFSYDMSVCNVAHLESQRGGCCTVMPYFIGKILELPLTTTQDYSLFHILKSYSLDLWKQQLELLLRKNGLISFIAHPDYLIERRANKVYESLLDYLRQTVAQKKVWTALPGEVDRWWRSRSQLNLVCRDQKWEIEGPDKERARVAFAVLDGDCLVYEVPGGGP